MHDLRQLLSVCLLAMASAQTAAAADILEAYRDAAASDPQLQAAIANREAAQEVRFQERARLLPDVRLNASRERTFNFETDTGGGSGGFGGGAPGADDGGGSGAGGGGSQTESSFDSHDINLDLNQPLYDREAQVLVRRALPIARQADADLASARQALVLRVAERYFNVLRALDNLAFRVSDKNAIARQLEQARRRFEVGLLTITDVFEAQARFDLAVTDEIGARNVLADALEALREVTGERYEEIRVLDAKAPLDPVSPADPEAWVALALANNPDLASEEFGVEIAEDTIALQRAGHYPILDFNAGRFQQDEAGIDSEGSRVGLQLNVPLYQGGAVTSRTREAQFQYQATRERLEQRRREIIRSTRDAYRGLEAARSRVKALEQAVVSNQSSLEATQAGFEVGTRTIVDVLNAERDLLSARRDLALSRYDYIINRLRLLQAAGRLAPPAMAAINVWLRQPAEKQPLYSP